MAAKVKNGAGALIVGQKYSVQRDHDAVILLVTEFGVVNVETGKKSGLLEVDGENARLIEKMTIECTIKVKV